MRFGFWGAEEFGDIGSGEYVASLSEAERAQFERVPQPGYGRLA